MASTSERNDTAVFFLTDKGCAENLHLAKAIRAIELSKEKAASDLTRPAFHFAPPANWINDPNGLIYYKGWYHMFYQHNPFESKWGHIHWGHARSKDLLHWEHLPIALWPSTEEVGELHCFSGSAWVNGYGQTMLFYTMIFGDPQTTPSKHGYAVSDDDMITWNKEPYKPFLTLDVHGSLPVNEWRDPYIFEKDGRTFMIIGGCLNENPVKGIVLLYEAVDKSLLNWQYKKILFTYPKLVRSIECPVFLSCVDKFVLIISTYGQVEYYSGDFDSATLEFTPRVRGNVDLSSHYYAARAFRDGCGRLITFAWINGFDEGKRHWSHCVSLPREISLGADGTLIQKPGTETSGLRGRLFSSRNIYVSGTSKFEQIISDQMEIYCEFELGGKFELDIIEADTNQARFKIAFTDNSVSFNGDKKDFSTIDKVKINVFIDRSMAEVFIDNKLCYTMVVHKEPSRFYVQFLSQGQTIASKLDIWELAL